jgi:hypothetical protein
MKTRQTLTIGEVLVSTTWSVHATREGITRTMAGPLHDRVESS